MHWKISKFIQNKKNILPIIETIILCGRQCLALRGTDDNGKINTEDLSEPTVNDGNFRSLLRLRMKAGDNLLKHHMKSAPLNATYLSPSIQNEIIKLCGKQIQNMIVEEIKTSKCFSILADETTEVSTKEQMSLSVRYVHLDKSKHLIKESFLEFVVLKDLTGRGLEKIILEELNNLEVPTEYLYGQGYDGAASMSGHLNGVQTVIRESIPKALYVHCSAHSLNLALSHACKVESIRNSIGTITKIGTFLRASAQRLEVLQQELIINNVTNYKTIVSMCEPGGWKIMMHS